MTEAARSQPGLAPSWSVYTATALHDRGREGTTPPAPAVEKQTPSVGVSLCFSAPAMAHVRASDSLWCSRICDYR